MVSRVVFFLQGACRSSICAYQGHLFKEGAPSSLGWSVVVLFCLFPLLFPCSSPRHLLELRSAEPDSRDLCSPASVFLVFTPVSKTHLDFLPLCPCLLSGPRDNPLVTILKLTLLKQNRDISSYEMDDTHDPRETTLKFWQEHQRHFLPNALWRRRQKRTQSASLPLQISNNVFKADKYNQKDSCLACVTFFLEF